MSKLFNKRKASEPTVVTSALKIASTLAEVSADLKRRGAKDVLEDIDGSMNGWLPVSQAKNLPAADGDDYHFEFSGRTEIKDGEECSEFWLYSSAEGEDEGPEEQFIVSKTYEIWDEESIDAGDTDQRGFEVKNEIWDRSDVIRELEQHNYIHPSSSDINSLRWVSTDGDTNYKSGEVTSYSLHLKDIQGHEIDGDQWASLLKEAGLLDGMHLTGVKTSSDKTAASSMDVAKQFYGFSKGAAPVPPPPPKPAIVAPAPAGGVSAVAPKGSDALKNAVWSAFQKEVGDVPLSKAQESYPGIYQAFQKAVERLTPMAQKFITKGEKGYTCTLPDGVMSSLKGIISSGLQKDKELGSKAVRSGYPGAKGRDGVSTSTSVADGTTTTTTAEQRTTDVSIDGRPQWMKAQQDKKKGYLVQAAAKEAEKTTKCVDCGKSLPVGKMVENSEGAGYLCHKCEAIRKEEDKAKAKKGAAKEEKAKGIKMAEEFEDLAQQLRTCDGLEPNKADRRINSVLSELSEALKHFGYPGLAAGVTKEGSSKIAFGTRDEVLEKWVRKIPLGPPAVDEIELVDEISVSPNGDERHYYLVRTYPDILTGGSSETLGEAKRYLNHLKDNGGNKGQFIKKVGSFSTGENPPYAPTHEDEIAKAKIREERAKRTAPAPDPSKDDISDIFHSITGHPGAKGRGEIKEGYNKKGHQAPMSCIANLDALKARRAVQAGRRSL